MSFIPDGVSTLHQDQVTVADVEVSIVIPCLSEEEGIGWTVDSALEGLARSGRRGEVLVVDNGSEDRTAEIAREHGARVVYEPHQGYGCAYLRGFAEARGEIVVMGDGDGTYDLRLTPLLLDAVSNGAALAMGRRLDGLLPGSMPLLHRLLGNPILSWLFSWWFGLRVSDVCSGMRAFRKSCFAPNMLRAPGMEFALEMLVVAARNKLSVVEVPIPYYARLGTSKLRTWRDGWRSLRFLLLASPDALLVYPGIAATFAGVMLLLLTLCADLGVAGRLPWSPSFSSGLCLFAGLQAMAFGSSLRAHLGIGSRKLRIVDAFFKNVFQDSRGSMLAMLLIALGVLARFIPIEGLFRGALAQLLVITGGEIFLWVIFAAALVEAGWLSRTGRPSTLPRP